MAYSDRPDAAPGADDHPVIEASRARQGLRGRHILWVLVISTLLAAVGLAFAWFARAPQLAATTSDNGDRHAAGPTFQAPAPPSPTPAPRQP